jgi:hypothetical protein
LRGLSLFGAHSRVTVDILPHGRRRAAAKGDIHSFLWSDNSVPMILAILSFLTLFLAILTPCVAMICKWEETKGLAPGVKRQPRPQQAESDASWIVGKRISTE